MVDSALVAEIETMIGGGTVRTFETEVYLTVPFLMRSWRARCRHLASTTNTGLEPRPCPAPATTTLPSASLSMNALRENMELRLTTRRWRWTSPDRRPLSALAAGCSLCCTPIPLTSPSPPCRQSRARPAAAPWWRSPRRRRPPASARACPP